MVGAPFEHCLNGMKWKSRARWTNVGRKQVDQWVLRAGDGLRKVTDWQGALEERWVQEDNTAGRSRVVCVVERS